MKRTVRTTDAFFDQLDAQLGPERGDEGEPSSTDVLVMELPPIVERFAKGLDELPEIVELGRELLAESVRRALGTSTDTSSGLGEAA